MSTSNLPPLPDLSPDWTPYWRGVVKRILRKYAEKAVAAERERCAALLAVTRADVSLAVGEMTAGEWRTCSAVLQVLRNRMRQP